MHLWEMPAVNAHASTRPSEPPRAEIERFYNAIPVGADNARTAEAIAYKLGLLTDNATPAQVENAKRRIRLYSQHAAKYGYVYGADNTGYFRPQPEELDKLSQTFGRRKSQVFATWEWLRQMEANVNAAMHQPSLFEDQTDQTAVGIGGPTQVEGPG